MWTKNSLQTVIREKMTGYKLVVVSNRQPYGHSLQNGKMTCLRQPGGLVTALDPVMRAANGIWIAVGSSKEDKAVVDEKSQIQVPAKDPSYSLKRIFLPKDDFDRYYLGYSNEGLWPLSHVAYTRPFFNDFNWKAYEKVNRIFADTVLDAVGDEKAFVWIQDYHLALVAKYLREANRPNIISAMFWHIPWPNPETFRICPNKISILEGMLAFDLLGFQIRYHADNFIAAVDREMQSKVDREKTSVHFGDHETLIRAFPISIDFGQISSVSSSAETADKIRRLRKDLSVEDKYLLVGVDRIDYTKGILDKLRAFDRFLDKYPQYRNKAVLFQLGQSSRTAISAYKRLNEEIDALVESINRKHGQDGLRPVILSRDYMPYEDILALYRAADVCIVSSLHDGMNLVAKEFVASRSDLGGVLILSEFTGAARELTTAVLVNPYDTEIFCDSIRQSLEMHVDEKAKRMEKMRETVSFQNIYRWAGKVLSQLLKFEFQEV